MTRELHSGAFLLVEGESSDLRVYGHLIAEESCLLVAAHGKENVVDALAILEREGLQGVLAVVDADFWHLEGTEPASQNLLLTDTHDLETMILASPALEKLLAEFGSPGKIKSLTKRSGKNVRQILLEGACPIGYLRWISSRNEFSLTFEGIRFKRFTHRDCLAVDVLKMIKTIKDKSCWYELDDEALRYEIDEAVQCNHDPWDVCCGHDLVCILSLGLQKAIGSKKVNDVNPRALERSLRMAYEAGYFGETRLYVSIRGWESANRPFQVLPAP